MSLMMICDATTVLHLTCPTHVCLIVQLTMYGTCQLRGQGCICMHQLYLVLIVIFDIGTDNKGDEYPMNEMK